MVSIKEFRERQIAKKKAKDKKFDDALKREREKHKQKKRKEELKQLKTKNSRQLRKKSGSLLRKGFKAYKKYKRH